MDFMILKKKEEVKAETILNQDPGPTPEKETDYSKAIEERRAVIQWKEDFSTDIQPAFAEVIGRIAEIRSEITKLKVEDKKTDEQCVSIGSTANKLIKALDERKAMLLSDERVALVLEYVSRVKNTEKVFVDELKEIKQASADKHANYVVALEQKRREEEKAAQEAAQKFQEQLNKDAAEKGIDPAQVPMPFIPKGVKTVKTESGSASVRMQGSLVIEVVNLEEVDRAYLVVSEMRVRDAFKAGVREFKGLNVYQRPVTVFK